MKHTYKIHGMTCNGCRNHVEGTLSKVKGVSKATVNLAKAEATIEMESHIPIEKFQDALKKEKVKDPRLPEIVLFGLILVSLGPLNNFPNIKPPISEKTHIKMHK